MKIEKILITLVIALSILLCISIYIDRCRIAQNKSNEANLKAYIALNDTLRSTNRMFEFKTSQLNYINDSLVNQMNTIRKSIGVKDRNLKGLGYIKSTVRIHDTVLVNRIRDGDKTLSIDTVINKKWYQIEIDYKGSSDLTFLGKQINANLLSGFVYKGDAFNADSDTFKSQYPTDGAVTGNIFIPYFKII